MEKLKILIVVLGVLLLGSLGWIGTACVAHLYQDHLTADQIRAILSAQQQARPQPPPQ